MEYGLQLYSVRDATEKDLAKALGDVARIGYKYVEFAGFFGHDAKEVKAMLDNNGLEVSGTHTFLKELDEDFAAAMKFHHTIGNKNFIMPSAPYKTAEQLNETIDQINHYQPLLAAEGIQLAYHNHSGEFMPNDDGLIAHNEMKERTNVDFEIDTYWAFHAGWDPVETITRIKDRVHMIHLKERGRIRPDNPTGGKIAPVAAIRQRAIDLGMLMVVEDENLTPDGITAAANFFRYLKSFE